MTTSYKDGVNAVERLLREAEYIRRQTDAQTLEDTGFPGYPLLRAHAIPEYLQRMRDWIDYIRRRNDKAAGK